MSTGKAIATELTLKDGSTFLLVTVARRNVHLSTAFDQAIARAWQLTKDTFHSAEAMSLDRYLELHIHAGRKA